MNDAEYDAVAAEVLRLIEEVVIPILNGKENALEVLQRVADLDKEVSIMLIVRGLEAAANLAEGADESLQTCAYFMALGAILALDHARRQRVVSIDRAKSALPDYVTADQFVDGGTCPKCGGSWYGGPACPNCTPDEATPDAPVESKDGQ